MLIVHASRSHPWGDGIEVRLGDKDDSGKLFVANVTFVEHEDGSFVNPALRLQVPEAQKLMDELWNCGVRPSEGAGSVGQLAAVQAHLQDMRTLLFDVIDKAPVGFSK